MPKELPARYQPAEVEPRVYRRWEEAGHFSAEVESARPSYCIMIPPPNVTDRLHVGHALNNTLQDALIRFHRMRGYNTLWMPGTDHAGIATQTVVEKRILAEEGRRRTDFEREDFVARIQAWKDEYEATITEQLKRMGCSCDWRRQRFTMDDVCARAVREDFFRLFRDGLIYRGKRLVNWDPATQTVLADDEVEHEEVRGHFYYLRYPLEEPVQQGAHAITHVTVATTRPETMLGDTAVAMNPRDPRAPFLMGKTVRLPIVGRLIPIIADDHVVLPDPGSADEKARFSTGFLKVTPAHDPDDYEIGQRHRLPLVNVLAPDGTISDRYGWADADTPEARNLIGMDRFEAREAIVEWFRTENLLEDVREYIHQVGHSYRSHVPIEPYLSDQWYIAVRKPIPNSRLLISDDGLRKAGLVEERGGVEYIKDTDVPVNSLAGLALAPLLTGRLRFVPERYAKTYRTWLENLRDWPISRQLWWGHRIPVWWKVSFSDSDDLNAIFDEIGYQTARNRAIWRSREPKEVFGLTGHAPLHEVKYEYVAVRDPENTDCDFAEFLEEHGFERDVDVLDTWFSSALWPFSTLGWPEDTAELKTFYPGNLLCTAREIITLWVSRMVMMGQYCVGNIPFPVVFIHAMIQDGEGRKMSKSLGNGIDPLDIIGTHGADAMRFTLVSMTTQTQDVRMPVERVTLPDGRTANTSPKFDIGRNFANKLWNAARFALMKLAGGAPPVAPNALEFEDRWILSRCNTVVAAVTGALEDYRFSDAAQAVYDFTWHDFCDWYIEIIKPRLEVGGSPGAQARAVLAFTLDVVLRLLHPIMPFITEELWSHLGAAVPVRGVAGDAEEASPRLDDRTASAGALMLAAWPKPIEGFGRPKLETDMASIQDVIRALRNIRSKLGIRTSDKIEAIVSSADAAVRRALEENDAFVAHLANLSALRVGESLPKPPHSAAEIVARAEVFVPLKGVVDVGAERARLEKKLADVRGKLAGVERKLATQTFVSRAPAEIVERERAKQADLRQQAEAIERNLAELP